MRVRAGHRRWSARRRLTVGAAVVVVAGAGLGTWLATKSSGAATTGPITTTSVQTVATGTITQTVASSGTVEPASQANLDFAVSGRVTAVDVTVGQSVSAGQVLASVDPTSLSASLALAQATLANDQATFATDQANGASSAQLTSDEASVASAQSQVASAQTAFSDANLQSTIAGTVAVVNLSDGQEVSGSGGSSSSSSSNPGSGGSGIGGAGSGSGGGGSGNGSSGANAASSGSSGSSGTSSASSAQVVVVSAGASVVNASVNSTQVSQLQVGDQAMITLPGSTSTVYGTVGSVGLLASTSSGVSSFPVVIDVTGNPPGLYGGTSATVSVVVKELQDVIVVPTAAITYSGGTTSVVLDEKGQHVTQDVTIGAASGGQTQITGGLSVGQRIVVTEVSFRGLAGAGSGTSGVFGRTGAGGGFGGGGFGGGGGGFGGGGGGFGGGGGAGFGG